MRTVASAFAVDPRRRLLPRRVRLARQRVQQQPLAIEPLTDRLGLAGDRALEILPARFLEQLVELLDRADLRHRHQMPAAEAPDLALDATLLVSALLTPERQNELSNR